MDAPAKVVLPEGKTGTVRMRRANSDKSETIMKIPAGSRVTILIDEGQWCKIQYLNETGWMMANFLEYEMPSAGEIDEDKASRIDNALKAIEQQIEIIGSIVGRG